MTVGDKAVTAGELLMMPQDGLRYELVKGELRKMPLAGDEHGDIAATLLLMLGQHVRSNDLGKVYAAETGFKLAHDPDTVRAPDVAFVRRELVEKTGRLKQFREGAPDLAAEVVSPSDSYSMVLEKTFDWLAAGARMVLVVDPDRRTVTVYRSLEEFRILTDKDTLDGGDVVPGWKLPVAELFA